MLILLGGDLLGKCQRKSLPPKAPEDMKAQADGNMPREADGHRNMGDAGGANRDRPRELRRTTMCS